MKKHLIYLTAAFGVLSGSCDEQLELDPISSISGSSFWQTEGDAESAVYGAYNQLRAAFKGSSNNRDLLFWGEFRTGFWTFGTSGGAGDWNQLWTNHPTRTTSGTNWSELYGLINDCNLILKHVPEIEFSDEQSKNEVLGHAYFLRSLAYFWIARIWGDAPLALEGFESPEQELNLPRSPVGEVYARVKEDVENALNMLPEGSPGNRPWLASKAAANMLKADVYLWTARRAEGGMSDLETAREAVDAVLAGNYQLEDNYEQVFRNDGSGEIIFSVYYDEREGGNQFGNQFVNQVTRVPAGAQDTIPVHPGPQWLRLSDDFVSTVLNPAGTDTRTRTIWREVEVPGTQPVVWINKYLGEVIQGTRQFTDDIRLYRLAEAILFKAEIENAMGNTAAAVAELNKIAGRAYREEDYYAASMNQEELEEAILQERLIELAVEGKAWFDIVRFGKAFEMIESLRGRENEYEGNILYFPVAQDVMNRNTSIEQTPGY